MNMRLSHLLKDTWHWHLTFNSLKLYDTCAQNVWYEFILSIYLMKMKEGHKLAWFKSINCWRNIRLDLMDHKCYKSTFQKTKGYIIKILYNHNQKKFASLTISLRSQSWSSFSENLKWPDISPPHNGKSDLCAGQWF